MSWVAVGVGVASMALGAYQKSQAAQAQQRAQKAQMLANAAQIQYSPFTHAGVQVMGNNAPDPASAGLEGGLQGGLAGYMMAKQFDKPSAPDVKAADQTTQAAAKSPAFNIDTQNAQAMAPGSNPWLDQQRLGMNTGYGQGLVRPYGIPY